VQNSLDKAQLKDCGSMHELTNKTNCVSDVMLCNSKINGFTNKMLIVVDENKREQLAVKLLSEMLSVPIAFL
jgi:hypothetical protein